MDNTYSISEVAEKLNLSDKTLRRWEEAGKFCSPRTLGNQRRYTIEDLQILDAIKHGTIPDQKDLLTREQAALLLSVSPVTVDRYVAEGKIHPFITVGTTYFPRHILEKKMSELKSHESPAIHIEPVDTKHQPPTPLPVTPLVTQSLVKSSKYQINPIIPNLFLTLVILILYHFVFNNSTSTISPTPTTSGSVQGISTISPQIIDLLGDVLDPSGNITGNIVTSKIGLTTPNLSFIPTQSPLSPTPGTIYFDATSQSLKIYVNNSWVTLATTPDLTKLSMSLDTQISSLSAELKAPLASPSSQIR